MAVSTPNNNKNNTSDAAVSSKTPLPKWLPKKPLAKQVLASPCTGEWPTLGKKATLQVTNAFVQCVVAKTDVGILKPPWKELRKVGRKLRQEAMAKHRSETLSQLPLEQREALLEALAKEKEQLSHVFLGYNEITRALQRGEVAALLVNKTATPELLPLSLVPACLAKGLPVVALDNLDKLWRKCIAIGFKKSVQSKECCFYPLYQKMLQVTKKAAGSNAKDSDVDDKDEEMEESADILDDDSNFLNPALTRHDLLLLEEKRLPPSTIVANKSSSKGSSERRQRPPPPVIDVSRYHLARTRTDQRAFIPGVGMNKMADTEDQELIMVATDVAGLEADTTDFNYRLTKKGYQGKKPHRGQGSEARDTPTLGDRPSGETDSSAACRDVPDDGEAHPEPIVPDLEKKSSDLMFQLDFDGEESSPPTVIESAESNSSLPKAEDPKKATTVKRKRSKLEKSSSYVPASVMRMVANAKRKKE